MEGLANGKAEGNSSRLGAPFARPSQTSTTHFHEVRPAQLRKEILSMTTKSRTSGDGAPLNPPTKKCCSIRFNFLGPWQKCDDADEPAALRHVRDAGSATAAEVAEGAVALRCRKGSGRSRTPTGTASRTSEICGYVTDAIVDALTQGSPPWRTPWKSGGGAALLPLRACGTPYRGINVVMLWRKAISMGYSAPFWMTYRQAAARGGTGSQGRARHDGHQGRNRGARKRQSG